MAKTCARQVWAAMCAVGVFTVVGFSPLRAQIPQEVRPSLTDSPSAAVVKAFDSLQGARLDELRGTLQPLAERGDAGAQFAFGFIHDVGLGVNFDPREGTKWQQKAAAAGHYWAAAYLSWKYRVGFGVESPDPQASERWRKATEGRKAPSCDVSPDWLGVNGMEFTPRFERVAHLVHPLAEHGEAQAMATLAQLFDAGLGVPRLPEQHVLWLRRAARAGHGASAYTMHLYHTLGVLVEADAALARSFLESSAAAGFVDAQIELADELKKGGDKAPDLLAAASWYRAAAKQGSIKAMNRLADLLRRGDHGLSIDYPEALQWSRRAAELGDPEAMSDLARMMSNGQGTPTDKPGALALYRAAAAKGYSYAKMMVGWMLSSGDAGPPDYEEARRWFQEAASDGNSVAMRELGRIYSGGRGVPKDEEKAFVWFERAARDGDSWAQNRLGWMLERGVGVKKDEEEAVTWFRLAAEGGEPMGHANLAVHYMRGRSGRVDRIQAFPHFVEALRKINEEWAPLAFAGMLRQSMGEERAELADLARKLATDVSIYSAAGLLPETLLGFLHSCSGDENRAAAAQILAELETRGRYDGAAIVAQVVFLGVLNPFDRAATLRWVERIKGKSGEVFRSRVESAAGESEAIRAAALAVLEQAAEREERPAILACISRILVANDTSRFPQAIRWHNVVMAREKRPMTDSIQDVYRYFGVVNITPLSEEEVEQRRDRLVRGRRQQTAQRIYSPVQSMPPELREFSPPRRRDAVKFRFDVSASGAIEDVEVLESEHPLLTMAALSAVKHWRYAPAVRDGVPVRSFVEESFSFQR